MLDPVATFQELRPRMFGLAYHMLGSISEAEDVLQDAYLRWHSVDHEHVQQPLAYLLRTVTHLCIDATDKAYRKRTEYIGPWLPEPLIQREELTHDVEQEELLSLAILRLLEQLNPVERAVFVLREVFDYSYREISELVAKSEAACRQIERRARQKISQHHDQTASHQDEHQQLFWRFLQAVREGDLGPLLELLAEDAVLYSDGGGKAKAALNPINGNDRVGRFFLGVQSKASPHYSVQPIIANHQIALLALYDGQPVQIITLHMQHHRISEIHIIMNPDKINTILNHQLGN